MEERIQKLEKEVELVKERNLRVEGDKAWETSKLRVLLISALIYIAAYKVLYFIGTDNYPLNALIPAVGYFISSQSLPFVKRWWLKRYYRK